MKNKKLSRQLINVLTTVAVLSAVFGTIYGVVQNTLRQSANDPQIQLASDVARNLDEGTRVDSLIKGHVDFDTSLAPFVIVYDKQGQPVRGNGYLQERMPPAPLGMLKASEGKKYNAVTWQPAKGVRIAAVTVASRDNYVLAGRSLREVERREASTLQLVVLGWLVAIVLYLIGGLVRHKFGR